MTIWHVLYRCSSNFGLIHWSFFQEFLYGYVFTLCTYNSCSHFFGKAKRVILLKAFRLCHITFLPDFHVLIFLVPRPSAHALTAIRVNNRKSIIYLTSGENVSLLSTPPFLLQGELWTSPFLSTHGIQYFLKRIHLQTPCSYLVLMLIILYHVLHIYILISLRWLNSNSIPFLCPEFAIVNRLRKAILVRWPITIKLNKWTTPNCSKSLQTNQQPPSFAGPASRINNIEEFERCSFKRVISWATSTILGLNDGVYCVHMIPSSINSNITSRRSLGDCFATFGLGRLYLSIASLTISSRLWG